MLTPRIHSKSSELAPVIVILSVMVGAHEFGIIGAIVAIPTVSSLREIMRYVFAKVNKQQPFEDIEEESEGGGAD